MSKAWPKEREEELERLWKMRPKIRVADIARRLGVTRNAIVGKSRNMNLHYEGKPMQLAKASPAAIEGRTIFPKSVIVPDATMQVLRSGSSNRKLGAAVVKGRWKGMPIYSLTLEERATCPRSCQRWLDCYGNHMHNAKRYKHGPQLIKAIARDLRVLQEQWPNGFVVRLHVLGDFYSVDYVKQWWAWLALFPALHVFGYTAWPASSPIGQQLETIRDRAWHRFAVRTSGGGDGPSAITIPRRDPGQDDLPMYDRANVIVCPAQTGASASCSTCSLCWAAPGKTIAFMRH